MADQYTDSTQDLGLAQDVSLSSRYKISTSQFLPATIAHKNLQTKILDDWRFLDF